MDKYFLVVIIGIDGKNDKAIYEYNDLDHAKQKALQQMSGWMLKDGVEFVKTFIDGPSNVEYYDVWIA